VCVCAYLCASVSVCVCVCVCVLPWNSALAEELGSAGEELLERELKGDCLKHSSRNELKRDTKYEQLTWQLNKKHIQKCRILHYYHNETNTEGTIDSPVYSHHVTVFEVVGFADFFCKKKEKKKRTQNILKQCQYNAIYT